MATSDYDVDADTDGRVGRAASVAVLIGVVAAIIAGATIWLLLYGSGHRRHSRGRRRNLPLVRQLAQVIYNALVGLLDYL